MEYLFHPPIETTGPALRSMGSTHRSRAKPLGRSDSRAVLDGNLLCSRAVLLMVLCSALGIMWCLEQPLTSTMEYHPLFQRLLRLVHVRRLSFRMSLFGAPTPKPTILYSSGLLQKVNIFPHRTPTISMLTLKSIVTFRVPNKSYE